MLAEASGTSAVFSTSLFFSFGLCFSMLILLLFSREEGHNVEEEDQRCAVEEHKDYRRHKNR